LRYRDDFGGAADSRSNLADVFRRERGVYGSLRDDERSVTFHVDRLELREGRAGSHSIDYGLLTAVRVDAKASGALRLVAVDASNRRWDIALRQDDLGRAQATLDIIDTRLGAAPSPAASLTLARLVALAALLLSGLAGQLAVMLVGSLAILKPGSPLIAATGMASMAAAVLVWRSMPIMRRSGSGCFPDGPCWLRVRAPFRKHFPRILFVSAIRTVTELSVHIPLAIGPRSSGPKASRAFWRDASVSSVSTGVALTL
jgi:hypothetical protein